LGISLDLRLNGSCSKAIGDDPMNGVAQQLRVTRSGAGALLQGILVRDWPLIIRLSDR